MMVLRHLYLPKLPKLDLTTDAEYVAETVQRRDVIRSLIGNDMWPIE